jgi:hypothetical protein
VKEDEKVSSGGAEQAAGAVFPRNAGSVLAPAADQAKKPSKTEEEIEKEARRSLPSSSDVELLAREAYLRLIQAAEQRKSFDASGKNAEFELQRLFSVAQLAAQVYAAGSSAGSVFDRILEQRKRIIRFFGDTTPRG